MAIFTIGYEGLTVATFLGLLDTHGIKTVVDVRELPLSRKPGFSKRELANKLNESGFRYIHMAALGCPKRIRDQYRLDGDWKNYTKGFLQHLVEQESSISELGNLVQTQHCALLCFEADANFCHRRFVAEAVQKNCGHGVEHINSRTIANSSEQQQDLFVQLVK